MEQQNRYCTQDMEWMLRCLAPIFDVVRLVDPEHMAVLRLRDGRVTEEPYTCFSVWNKDCRCKNCTSLQAAAGNCRRTKYEFIHNDVFYVISQPLTLVLAQEERRVVLDLRQFKKINDTRGHLAGDQVLEEVAAVLRRHVRAQDSVIRFGGDEFVVILTDCDEPVVRRKVEDLRRALSPVLPADFGYAYTDHFLAEQSFLMAMVEEADRRMYEEKRRSGETEDRNVPVSV